MTYEDEYKILNRSISTIMTKYDLSSELTEKLCTEILFDYYDYATRSISKLYSPAKISELLQLLELPENIKPYSADAFRGSMKLLFQRSQENLRIHYIQTCPLSLSEDNKTNSSTLEVRLVHTTPLTRFFQQHSLIQETHDASRSNELRYSYSIQEHFIPLMLPFICSINRLSHPYEINKFIPDLAHCKSLCKKIRKIIEDGSTINDAIRSNRTGCKQRCTTYLSNSVYTIYQYYLYENVFFFSSIIDICKHWDQIDEETFNYLKLRLHKESDLYNSLLEKPLRNSFSIVSPTIRTEAESALFKKLSDCIKKELTLNEISFHLINTVSSYIELQRDLNIVANDFKSDFVEHDNNYQNEIHAGTALQEFCVHILSKKCCWNSSFNSNEYIPSSLPAPLLNFLYELIQDME